MRTLAAAVLVLAGIVGIGLDDVASALRNSYAAGDVAVAGWITFSLGIALMIIEYVPLVSPDTWKR